MHNIKKGDIIKMLSGRDRGKTGKVLRTLPKREMLVVEGLNVLVKHLRPRRQGEQGQRVQFPAPFPRSRAMVVCPKCSVATRSGATVLTDGTKQRRCHQCGQTFA
ncbi:MAG: 50S ribosomal protein L24 [bacterium]|nr:50S ribosomal protein L24 [bacterium]